MSQLVNILTDLAADPVQQRAFAADPAGFATELGLSEAEMDALLAGSREQISALVARGLPVSHQVAVSCNSFFADPGPDPDTDPEPWPEEGDKD